MVVRFVAAGGTAAVEHLAADVIVNTVSIELSVELLDGLAREGALLVLFVRRWWAFDGLAVLERVVL